MAKPVHVVNVIPSPLQGVEAISLHSGHTFPRHSHDHIGIGVISQGAQHSWSLIGKTEAGPGDVIIVNPGEIHDGVPLNGPRAWQMLYLEPELLMQELKHDGYTADAVLHPCVHDVQLRRQLLQLFAEMTQMSADEGSLEEMLLQCMMHLSRHHLLTAPHRAGFSPSIKLAKECLDDAPARQTTLSELAALCHLSRFQLIRGFANEVGTTPHAYLMQLRVRQARHWLLQGYRIVDVAAMAGFADQSHLTRAFVRQMGMTPARYQQALQP